MLIGLLHGAGIEMAGIGALRQLFASDDGAISSPPAPYHLSAGGSRIRTLGPPARVAQLPYAGQSEDVSPLQGFEPSVARKRDNGLQPQKLAPGDELGATIRTSGAVRKHVEETQRDFDVFAADGTLPVFGALILRRAGYNHDCFDIMKQTQ